MIALKFYHINSQTISNWEDVEKIVVFAEVRGEIPAGVGPQK